MRYDESGNWMPVNDAPMWVHEELEGIEAHEITLPMGDYIDGNFWYGWFDNEGDILLD